MDKHWIRRNWIYRGYMLCKARLAWRAFGKPGESLRCIGITGTDGKSTTSMGLYHLLTSAGVRVWLISTVYIDVWDGLQDNHSHMTSLDHKVFRDKIRQAEHNGLTHMVIEVSSHALYQYRTWPLRFVWAGITNLTREHLDFHRTMTHYARSKAELFGRVIDGGRVVVPQDFLYQQHFSVSDSIQTQMFGRDERSDIFVDALTQDPQLHFDLHLWDEMVHIDSPLVGAFNLDNLMIATLLADQQWLTLTQIQQGLQSYRWLPGRQELIHTQEGITAMIDFAVTPDALETVYTAARAMWYQRLIGVFGATWDRDQGKRPKMGAVAAQLCDIVIVTEDENYHEDGMEIMKQVESWVSSLESQAEYELVQDRSLAIRRGLELAESWDVVIVTGMANFTTRSMNEWSMPRNEKEVIQEQMRELGYHIVKSPTPLEKGL